MSYSWYSISTYAETDFSLAGYFAVDSANTIQEFYDASGETPQTNIIIPVASQIPNNSYNNQYVEGWQGFDGNGVSINYGGYTVLLTGDTSPYNGQATFFSGTEFVTRQYTQYMIEPISDPFPQLTAEPDSGVTPISNICFPGKTPINTDQCRIYIEKIDPAYHTINGKRIICVTKTVTLDDYLICFEKDAFAPDCPYEKTVTTKNHRIFYEGAWIEADKISVGSKVAYNGEFLYNILLDTHEYVKVNGLICETLEPTNLLSKIYTSDMSDNYKNLLFFIMNTAIKNGDKTTLTVLSSVDYENISYEFLNTVISKFYNGTLGTFLPSAIFDAPVIMQYSKVGHYNSTMEGVFDNFDMTHSKIKLQNKTKMGFTPTGIKLI
jgi:hypothetical protein